ncbi:flagellar protein FliT [Shewanella sp. WXL01]|uniref:flagellar protein FliT n=1 Tax=Shewanella sp. WXL01 TaxID=2709721 RepID=UPI00143856FB|nr:flagellar protein FliT [Shewanella sp. WXL01]NKF51388.1 flagellar protein FliT [Shewanella sp. WXL01]
MPARNWKRQVPSSLTHALRLCKEHGKEKQNLSVERISDRMASSVDTLYKWLGNGNMPVNQLINYEAITTGNSRCGRPFVTEYLAHSHGYLLVKMPSARNAEHTDVIELNIYMQQFVAELLSLQNGDIEADEVLKTAKSLLQDIAHHHKQIEQHDQPQLDLVAGDLAGGRHE